MKKSWIVLAIVLVLSLVLLVGCNGKTQEDYNSLQYVAGLMQDVSYPITLAGQVTTDGTTFHSRYVVSREGEVYAATYRYERLARFTVSADAIAVPDSYIETIEGSLKVKDNVVIEQNGEAANLSVSAVTLGSFSLRKNGLDDVSVANGVLKATVTDPVAVLGYNVDASDIRIEAHFTRTAVQTLSLTYRDHGKSVSLLYTFGA